MPITDTSATKQCIAYFCAAHKESLQTPYLVSWGKDQAIIKQIAATYGVEKTCYLIALFFEALRTDKFLQQTGASVGIFKTQIPKLLLKIDEKTNKSQVGRL
jgi:hypothetical protein